jgi:hypothetical protein
MEQLPEISLAETLRQRGNSVVTKQFCPSSVAHEGRGTADRGERGEVAGAAALADFRVPIFC